MSWSQNEDVARFSGPGFLLFPRLPCISSVPCPESIFWVLERLCSLVSSPHFQCSLQETFLGADPFISVNGSETHRRRAFWGPEELLLLGGWGENLIWSLELTDGVLGWGNTASSLHNQGGSSQWRVGARRELTPLLSACTGLFTHFAWL